MHHADLWHQLPPSVNERVRVLRDGPRRSGDFVLYWLHHAMRGHENPALDAALAAADVLRLPVLVYQGIAERDAYASDRHHTFILEGVRDLQDELEQRGVHFVCHVERRGHRGPHLQTLAGRAALLVTEEFPAQPTLGWLKRVVDTTECPVWCVDTACVIPMKLIAKSFDRAFRFREATASMYQERVSRTWEDLPSRPRRGSEQLPFQPVDVRSIGIPELTSECEIDHMVGPVPHTLGGSMAGYRRWDRFRRSGLSRYADSRNDPLVDGVSRMSAYLHYGMVSPLRIAREAAADDAEKFLDELLIWRELAHNFCFHHADHDQLSVLPRWARDTLRASRVENRRSGLSWERLSRGRTGDELWDAAQTSLLIHGELHNNVRMTWGKAILEWTDDPEAALAMMIDLNHRYALDGRDPNSYGGILWCLGLFDRPFEPPQPIFGTVRQRSPFQHAARLDTAAYKRHVNRPLFAKRLSVAVIGAGISGLTCARTLADHGVAVTVIEKSAGAGGRMATRRNDSGGAFDHGAQYFTVRDPRFQRHVDSWRHDGLVQPWEGRIVSLSDGTIESDKSSGERFVASPGMNAICKHLAAELPLLANTLVASPRRQGESWLVPDEAGKDVGVYDVVLVATPAAQAARLLEESDELARQASSVTSAGCWAVMAQFPSRIQADFDGAFVQNSPLGWIARNSSKPGRPAREESWVLHATGEWTDAHLEEPAEAIQLQLLSAFWEATGLPECTPVAVAAHRWRYSLPNEPLPDRCLFDRQSRIGACGDWCSGPRVEAAFLSGAALAGTVLGLMTEPRA